MAQVRELLARKGSEILAVAPEATVLEAARMMNDHGTGSVLVVAGNRLAGIFTERDVMRRVVAVERDPARTAVAEVMTADLVTGSPEASLEDCASLMSSRRIRHLPIMGPRGVIGLLTTGDLLAWRLADHEATIQHLNSYVYDNR